MEWWVNVQAKKPSKMVDVLAYDGNGIARAWYTDKGWASWDEDFDLDTVTHWMPMPEPPEVTADG